VVLYLENHLNSIAKSTVESKFIALELIDHEEKWLIGILADIPLQGKPTP